MRYRLPRPAQHTLFVLTLLSLLMLPAASGAAARAPHLQTNGVILPDDRQITPVGQQTSLGNFTLGLAVANAGNQALVLNSGMGVESLMAVDTQQVAVTQVLPMIDNFQSVVLSQDGGTAYVAGGGDNVHIYSQVFGFWSWTGDINVGTFPSGLALAPDGQTLYVATDVSNTLDIINLSDNSLRARVNLGMAPDQVSVSPDGKWVIASNWGGQSVSVVNASTDQLAATIPVGDDPNAIVVSPDSSTAYVSDANTDSVSVISLSTLTVTSTIDMRPYQGAPYGAQPDALTLRPNGKTLYVALAEENAVAMVATSTHKIEGLIPTGWYPSALGMTPDGQNLLVTNARGNGIGPNCWICYQPFFVVGTMEKIPVPSASVLSIDTAQVAYNDHFPAGATAVSEAGLPAAFQAMIGPKSPIKHVVVILRENKTYDEEFSDIPAGNGDTSLLVYGQKVTPNSHALANKWVLFDNTYVDGEVSTQGHQWIIGGLTDYMERTWPQLYSYRFPTTGSPYDNNNYLTFPTQGYLFDDLAAMHISFRDYGEFLRTNASGVILPSLANSYDPKYNGDSLMISDMSRFQEWDREFKLGIFPSFEEILLPQDHTAIGAGYPSPNTMVATNDLATAKIIQTISHSQYWKSTAVFVIEDDPQGGGDHVDAHRTIMMVASPWIQRGIVDHTHEDQASLLRTVELLLHANPVNQVDALTRPIADIWTTKPNFAPFNPLPEHY